MEQTVGKLLEGKTPRQAAQLKILDPACGSGSFLIGAYQYLLDWHRDAYLKDGAEKHTKVIYQGAGGEWRLTTAERRRILLNNIYGVDIDQQAVEVTKLSLLLKVLEGETEETLSRQLRFIYRERALPDLRENIKCGNSLIGPDFYQTQQLGLAGFDEEERYRINVFDWEAEFPQIMRGRNPGFDAVIGNPPYLNVDDVWGSKDERLAYLRKSYSHVYNDKTDILFYFLARAVDLSRGHVGFIVSRAFLEAYKADKLRAWLASNSTIRHIIDFQDYYIFRGVGITTAIVVLDRAIIGQQGSFSRLRGEFALGVNLDLQLNNDEVFERIEIDHHRLGAASWILAVPEAQLVLDKIDSGGPSLGDLLFIGQGMQTGRNKVFANLTADEVESLGVPPSLRFLRSRNSDISRYMIRESGRFVLYLEDLVKLDAAPREVQEYLQEHKSELTNRAAYKRGDCEWWKFTWPLHKDRVRQPKIITPYLARRNQFGLDSDGSFLGLTDTTVLYAGNSHEDMEYVLGLLNSKLLTFRFRYIAKLKSQGIREYFWNNVSQLPIRTIDFDDPTDVERHDRMVSLVQQMLDLHQQLDSARTDQDKRHLQRLIDHTDREIDHLVYELYHLTEEEIAIVEAEVG